jgi:plastocyanin
MAATAARSEVYLQYALNDTSENTVAAITIKGLKFEPETLRISAGTTVIWTNNDPYMHDVTSGTALSGRKARGAKQTKFPSGEFRSSLFPKDMVFSFKFDERGEFDYFCDTHPFMNGKIIVE